jgi:hypothetical protein
MMLKRLQLKLLRQEAKLIQCKIAATNKMQTRRSFIQNISLSVIGLLEPLFQNHDSTPCMVRYCNGRASHVSHSQEIGVYYFRCPIHKPTVENWDTKVFPVNEVFTSNELQKLTEYFEKHTTEPWVVFKDNDENFPWHNPSVYSIRA